MSIMPRRRIITALSVSLLLHIFTVGGLESWMRARQANQRPVAPAIVVTLAERRRAAHDDPDPLLKDTLAKAAPRDAAATAATGAGWSITGQREAARHKLSGHLFYPPEAVARGLEGEVRLLLNLDGTGNIVEVQLASSSGYAVLDQAAIDAARAMGRLDGGGTRELILPVDFKLK